MSKSLGLVRDTLFYVHRPHQAAFSDPEGILFYDDDSNLNGPVDYRFWYNTGTTDHEAAVVAQFYVKGTNTYIAEV
jgi:hypothetical protein